MQRYKIQLDTYDYEPARSALIPAQPLATGAASRVRYPIGYRAEWVSDPRHLSALYPFRAGNDPQRYS